jgi:hypothetical protein
MMISLSKKNFRVILGIVLCLMGQQQVSAVYQEQKRIIIIGGGHLGLIEAYLAFLRAEANGEEICIDIFEKNASMADTTAANIWNSHTADEIVAVVPCGTELDEKLTTPFDKPGGMQVPDVPGVGDSESAQRFIKQVAIEGPNEKIRERRTKALLKLGKAGMALWKQLYETADEPLKAVLKASNFNPCCELESKEKADLHKGYRIDLIYDVPNEKGTPSARDRAVGMMKNYQDLGYKNCQILSPDEVVARDPNLAQFCALHSTGEKRQRQWKEDTVALWRPGGCLDTQTFLPKFAAYLKTVMGQYVDKKGRQQERFRLHFNKKVTGVIYGGPTSAVIKGLTFADGTRIKSKDSHTTYVFCPGEAVGTLHNLGFNEPAYAGFAGASLSLNIPVSREQLKEFEGLNHCMEVHKVGVVLAWQARIRDGKIFVGGAGTKAFYGDKTPTIHDAFATNRNLLQLRMFNDVLPQVVSLALGRDTTGQQLTEQDMAFLEKEGMAKRWVGRRAVAYDGFPTLGRLYHQGKIVPNGRVTTHLGSGGGSFSLITALISHFALVPEGLQEKLERVGLDLEFVQEVLGYADSRRSAKALG